MSSYQTPGVYRKDVFLPPLAELRTGAPAFLGFAETGEVNVPCELALWPRFEETFGSPLPEGYLAQAVRGFFENGGEVCYVVRLDDTLPTRDGLNLGLETLIPLDDIDLLCIPDVMLYPAEAASLQQVVLEHCDGAGDRFAILDSLPDATLDAALVQRGRLSGTNGALYYPWVRVLDERGETGDFIPPCGHVAGVYARSDRRVGVHKAPANEVLEGVLDLQVNLSDAQQGFLNPEGVNCLRAFPGRGIRVWGARTLSGDPNWTYVNVRRLFITAGRWIERNLTGMVFEPNDLKLWTRITRELTAYFTDLFRRGALKGGTPQEAFYVKCDAETNPAEVQDAGMVVTEIGLAPAVPGEFIVVRIIHGDSGVTITAESEPTPPALPVEMIRRGPARGAGPSTAVVRIAHIEYNPPGSDIAGEYVLIENQGSVSADLTNWTLQDLAGHTFVFPHFVLAPGASVQVWTKRGSNTVADLYWGRGVAIWSNVGDRASLRDSKGNPVDVYTYTPVDVALSK